jgi:hypothetical protein
MAKTLASSTATSRQPLLGDASTSGRTVRFLPKAFGAHCLGERSSGRSDVLKERSCAVMKSVTSFSTGAPHTPSAGHRTVHRAGAEDGGRRDAPRREVRHLPRRMRMNLNEPRGSVFWPMTLRPVRLYVHSRETYATRRFQEVTHTGDAIEGMNHVRQREDAERKGS